MKNLFLTISLALLTIGATAQRTVNYETVEQKLNDAYCTGIFKSADGTIIDVESQVSVKAYLNILDWMQGRVSGLQVYQNRYGTSIPVLRGQVPAIFVDELQVSANYLNSLSVNDIAMIKVIKTPFLGGFNGAGGAIAIYTIMEEEETEEDSE